MRREENSTMVKTILKIDGMMCGMCEAHVRDAIRRAVPEARKVTASRSRKEAEVLTDGQVDAELLKAAVDATGYSCLSVESTSYRKRGLFRR